MSTRGARLHHLPTRLSPFFLHFSVLLVLLLLHSPSTTLAAKKPTRRSPPTARKTQPPTLSPTTKCVPDATLSKKDCQTLASTPECLGKLAWVGPGCGATDGGCQKAPVAGTVYCGWQCQSKCQSTVGCAWVGPATTGTCQTRAPATCAGTPSVTRGTPDLVESSMIRVADWSKSGMGDFFNVTVPFRMCRMEIYLAGAKKPAPLQQVNRLVMSSALVNASTFEPVGTELVSTFYLSQMTDGGFVGDQETSAAMYLIARYDTPDATLGPDFSVAGTYRIRFAFPDWTTAKLSLLTRTEVLGDGELDGTCSFTWNTGESTTSGTAVSLSLVDTCSTFSTRTTHRLLLNMFSS